MTHLQSIPALKKLLRSVFRKKRSKGLGLLGAIALKDKKAIDKVLPEIKRIARRDINYQVRLDAVAIIRKLIEKNKKLLKAVELLGEILRKDRNLLVYREASRALEGQRQQRLTRHLDTSYQPISLGQFLLWFLL